MDDTHASSNIVDRLEKYVRENFISYCPATTFAAGNDDRLFLNSYGVDCLKGWQIKQGRDSSLSRLFDLGSEAFALLTRDKESGVLDRATFRSLFSGYTETVTELRTLIKEKIQAGSIVATYEDGRRVDASAVVHIEDVDAIKIGRSITKAISPDDDSWQPFYVGLMAVGCLREIDHALVALIHNPEDAIESVLIAKELFDLARIGETENEITREFVIRRAKSAAAAKLANDPKQYAKEQIYKAWIEWREGRAQYGKRNSQAAFASTMREKWDVIENVRSIENWCRDWKNGKNIPLIEPA